MSIFLPNFCYYLLVSIISLLLLWGIGRVIMCLLPEWKNESNSVLTTLNCYVLGLLFVLPIFALLWARGNSMFIITILIWLMYILLWRTKRPSDWAINIRKEMPSILISLAVFGLIYSIHYYFFFVRSGGQIFTDQIYYSNTIYDFLRFHHESNIRLEISVAQPYHLGDHWLGALFTFMWHAKPLYVLCLMVYPIYLTLYMLAAYSFTAEYKLPHWMCFLMSLLSIFFFNITSLATRWPGGPLLGAPKNAVMILLVAMAGIYLIKQEFPKIAFCLLMVVSIYSTLSAGVLTLLCVLTWCDGITNNKGFIKTLLNPYVISAIVIAITYAAFYYFQPKVIDAEIIIRTGPDFIKDAIMFVPKRLGRPLATVLPISIVVIAYFVLTKRQSELKKYLLILLCVLISCLFAIITGGVMRQIMIDGGQIATNYYDTVCRVFVFFSFIYLCSEWWMKTPKMANLVLIFVLTGFAILFVTNITTPMFPKECTKAEEQRVYAFLKEKYEKSPIKAYGYIRNYNLPDNHNTAKTRYDLFFPMDKMIHIIPDGYYRPYCLSAFDLPNDIDPKWYDMNTTDIWQYAQKNNLLSSPQDAIEEFINDIGINYIVVEKGAQLPNVLTDKFEEIISFDGNIIYYLK